MYTLFLTHLLSDLKEYLLHKAIMIKLCSWANNVDRCNLYGTTLRKEGGENKAILERTLCALLK